jgi:hypothetical protein
MKLQPFQSTSTNTITESRSVDPAISSPSLQNTPRLNDDVIFVVIEHLYYDSRLLPDWRDFPRYALVARLWRIPVQRLLFHEVKITSTDANYEALRKAVDPSTEHGRQLRNSVRILNYTLSPGSPTIPAYKATSWEKRLPVALKLFPYLYELRLNIDAVDNLSPSVIRALDNGTPPIRALQIGMRSHPTRKTDRSNVPLQLLQISSWPLEAIVFRGERWPVNNFKDFPPVKHQFHEVRWLCPEPVDGPLETFLKYLTSNSSKSLQILHVPHVAHILPEWAPSLRSVLLTGANPSILQQLPQLPFLREVVISDTTNPINIEAQLSTLATLPQKLEHVGFTMALDEINFSTLEKAIVSMPQTIRVLSIYTPPAPPALTTRTAQAKAREAVGLIGTQKDFPNVSVHLYEDTVQSRVGQVKFCTGPFRTRADDAASGQI